MPHRAVALIVLVGGYGGALLGVGVVRDWKRPTDWQIALCDVGQGDAVLVRDGGQTALIDTGPDPAPLRACLDTLGVEHIDLLVLTHYDRDTFTYETQGENAVGTGMCSVACA